jgi:hypothetical protein
MTFLYSHSFDINIIWLSLKQIDNSMALVLKLCFLVNELVFVTMCIISDVLGICYDMCLCYIGSWLNIMSL